MGIQAIREFGPVTLLSLDEIDDDAVIVPTYGVPEDEAALEAIGRAFDDREVIGLSARPVIRFEPAPWLIAGQKEEHQTGRARTRISFKDIVVDGHAERTPFDLALHGGQVIGLRSSA